MATGACGIDCNACRLKIRGLCMGCGAGTGSIAKRKLDAQNRIFRQCCPILKCARDHHVAVCLRDCRRFPCRIFEQGPAPFSASFLRIQKSVRKTVRPPSMDLEKMAGWESDELDPDYWQRLMYSDPAEICRRAMVSYCRDEEAYQVDFLGQPYSIYPFLRTLTHTGRGGTRSPYRQERIPFGEALILLSYLLKAKEVPLSERWVTEKDLPGGETFFRGPHKLACEPVLKRYGRDMAGFVEAGLCLGGKSLSAGDASIRLQVLPRVPLNYILWQEDEEFSPHLTVAFDASAGEHLPLDVIWALVHVVSSRLARSSPNGGESFFFARM